MRMNDGVFDAIGQGIGQGIAPAIQQTSADVNSIASEAKGAATAALLMQAVSTAAICVLAYIAWKQYCSKKGC